MLPRMYCSQSVIQTGMKLYWLSWHTAVWLTDSEAIDLGYAERPGAD